MMNKKFLPALIIILFLTGCISKKQKGNDIYYKKYNKNTEIGKIHDIPTNVVCKQSVLYCVNNYLIVQDVYTAKKGIHIFNLNTFEHVTSTGIIGRGPNEIGRMGPITEDPDNNCFWVSDWAKLVMWKFPIDSIISQKDFKPSIKLDLPEKCAMWSSGFLNDSIIFGPVVKMGEKAVNSLISYNIHTKKMDDYGYRSDKLGDKLTFDNSMFYFSISDNKEKYACAYKTFDLITVCNVDGSLAYNIYGPLGMDNQANETSTYFDIQFFEDYLIAAYNGGKKTKHNAQERPELILPTRLLVFDHLGKYVKTIYTKEPFWDYVIDTKNKKVIAYFTNRENPLGYFDLKIN